MKQEKESGVNNDFNSILEIKGKQYLAQPGKTIKVDKLNSKENEEFQEIKVLFYRKNEKEVFFGNPYLENVKVKATIKGEHKDKKVKVVHYKPKSGIRKMQGHRQKYTWLEINEILFS